MTDTIKESIKQRSSVFYIESTAENTFKGQHVFIKTEKTIAKQNIFPKSMKNMRENVTFSY
jgi:hypothetical protein